MTPDAYVATHRVPLTGLKAWATPDASQPAAADLAPNLDVQLLRWWGEWAEIRCSNGWTAWVGGRQLVATAAAPTGLTAATVQERLRDVPLPAGVSPLAAGGAALMLLGSFLPWLSAGPFDVNAWDVPFLFLFTGEDTLSGFDIGLVILVVAVAVVVVPLLTKRPLDTNLLLGAAAVAIGIAVLHFLRVAMTDGSDLSVGFGTVVTAIGGVLLAVAYQQARRGVGARGGRR